MKYKLSIIFSIVTFFHSFGQVEKIIFTSRHTGGLTKMEYKGTLYIIEFKKQGDGDFVASRYNFNGRRQRLKNKIKIHEARIEKVTAWNAIGKKKFDKSDLEINIDTLRNRNRHHNYRLSFEIPDDLTISIDSFQFCRPFEQRYEIADGGLGTISVALISTSGERQDFIFEIGGQGIFKFKDYLYCYALFAGLLPSEIRYHEFFSKVTFIDLILYYQKTVECEEYYYKEYTDSNPQMTSQEKRLKKGWNFVEYIKNRQSKK